MPAPSNPITLGVYLGGTKVLTALVDATGTIVASHRRAGKGYRQGTRPGAGPAISWRPLHFPGAPPPPTTQDPLESPLRSDYEGNSEP